MGISLELDGIKSTKNRGMGINQWIMDRMGDSTWFDMIQLNMKLLLLFWDLPSGKLT